MKIRPVGAELFHAEKYRDSNTRRFSAYKLFGRRYKLIIGCVMEMYVVFRIVA